MAPRSVSPMKMDMSLLEVSREIDAGAKSFHSELRSSVGLPTLNNF